MVGEAWQREHIAEEQGVGAARVTGRTLSACICYFAGCVCVTWALSCLCPAGDRTPDCLESVVAPWEGGGRHRWGTTDGMIS